MQTLLVLLIVAVAVGYIAGTYYRALKKTGACGCRCSSSCRAADDRKDPDKNGVPPAGLKQGDGPNVDFSRPLD